MRVIAEALNQYLNPEGDDDVGFIVLVAPFHGDGDQRCNYVSNARRKDCITWMKETVARFEGQAETGSTALN